MEFYKMQGQEMAFQLLNLEVREDFALWDNMNKKFLRQLEGVANLNDIKFMRQELFVQRYPHLRKNTQYVREIVVYEQQPTQYSFGFKKTANDDLNKAITNNKNLGVNPLEVLYKLRKTGQGIDTAYAIVVLERIGLPQNVQQSQSTSGYKNEVKELRSINYKPQTEIPYMQASQKPMIMQQSVQNPIVPIKTPETSHFKPTEALQQGVPISKVLFGVPNEQKVVVLQEGNEKEIYEASCNYPEKLTEERYIELWNDCAKKYFNTMFETQRIKDIYNELYANNVL